MSETASERAKALFNEGYNCAQSVLGAFAPQLGMELKTAVRLTSGMGGGIGGLRETCGAVSGMVMALSLAQGYDSPDAKAEKRELYAAVRELAGQFREKNGSICCRELLAQQGIKQPSPNPSERNEFYFSKRSCGDMCACAAGILEAYLQQSK